jgi:hypothetical protein
MGGGGVGKGKHGTQELVQGSKRDHCTTHHNSNGTQNDETNTQTKATVKTGHVRILVYNRLMVSACSLFCRFSNTFLSLSLRYNSSKCCPLSVFFRRDIATVVQLFEIVFFVQVF